MSLIVGNDIYVCKDCGTQWNQDTVLKAGNRFGNAACQSCGFDLRLWPPDYKVVFMVDEWDRGW